MDKISSADVTKATDNFKLDKTYHLNASAYSTETIGIGRAICLKNMSKAKVEELHAWEDKIGRILAPGIEISRIFGLYNIFPRKKFTNENIAKITDELNKRRPKSIEPRPCTKCYPINWKSCSDLKNGLCNTGYTDLEYRHVWDWCIFHNSPKEMFIPTSRRDLISEVD